MLGHASLHALFSSESFMANNTVITFGTFDLLHVGHLRLLKRAAEFGDKLIVGVSSDELNYHKKQVHPIYTQDDRLEIISGLECVDEVFLEESLDLKRSYLREYSAEILVMGDDWAGKFDCLSDAIEVVYLPRTKRISTTFYKEKIQSSS